MALRSALFDAATTKEFFAAVCLFDKLIVGVAIDDVDAPARTALRADKAADRGGGWLVHGSFLKQFYDKFGRSMDCAAAKRSSMIVLSASGPSITRSPAHWNR